MNNKKRRRLITKDDSEATFELDLAPMLALMVTLIPIMLLATSFVKVRVINTVLPQAVKEAIQNDKENLNKTIVIDLNMNLENFEVIVKENGKEVLKTKINNVEKKWDYEGLHSALYNVKKQFPKKFSLNLYPQENIPYHEIVKAIDHAREAKKSEEMFNFIDKKTQENVKTRLMFPEVSFSGLIGG